MSGPNDPGPDPDRPGAGAPGAGAPGADPAPPRHRPPGGRLSPPGAAWPGRTSAGRASRATLAGVVAITGLALLTLGPAIVAAGWLEVFQARAAASDTSQPLGVPVQDGPVTFTVLDSRCQPSEQAVHGVWCEVTISARNQGEDEITILGSAQHLHGAEGTRHLPVSDDRPFGTLAPGEEETTVLEFDVPPHAEITHMVVHASPYSGGVMVDLTPD